MKYLMLSPLLLTFMHGVALADNSSACIDMTVIVPKAGTMVNSPLEVCVKPGKRWIFEGNMGEAVLYNAVGAETGRTGMSHDSPRCDGYYGSIPFTTHAKSTKASIVLFPEPDLDQSVKCTIPVRLQAKSAGKTNKRTNPRDVKPVDPREH